MRVWISGTSQDRFVKNRALRDSKDTYCVGEFSRRSVLNSEVESKCRKRKRKGGSCQGPDNEVAT